MRQLSVLLLLVAACAQEPTPTTPREVMPPLVFEEERPSFCDQYPGGPKRGDHLLVLVNKEPDMQLRCDWEPQDLAEIPGEIMMPGREGRLRRPVLEAYVELHEAAREDGLELGIRSAYRSFETQIEVVRHKLERYGREHTERYSAMPGRSQHQLGTTIDISSESLRWKLNQRLADTREGRWLAANAHRFGFALSYPDEEEDVTGYAFEPWHYRFIGKEAAAEMRSTGLILEEYLRGCSEPDTELRCPDAPTDLRLAQQ